MIGSCKYVRRPKMPGRVSTGKARTQRARSAAEFDVSSCLITDYISWRKGSTEKQTAEFSEFHPVFTLSSPQSTTDLAANSGQNNATDANYVPMILPRGVYRYRRVCHSAAGPKHQWTPGHPATRWNERPMSATTPNSAPATDPACLSESVPNESVPNRNIL